MKDMGVPTFLITATVEAILAQRLVRRICAECKEETDLTQDMLLDLDLKPEAAKGKKVYQGAGCGSCANTGYKGRIALFELMIMDDELRDMINDNANTDDLRDKAQSKGMRTLRDSGIELMFAGTTTPEEIIRETVVDG
jgi:type IV pilus assembly protein PilB